jgi:hypothetical protein
VVQRVERGAENSRRDDGCGERVSFQLTALREPRERAVCQQCADHGSYNNTQDRPSGDEDHRERPQRGENMYEEEKMDVVHRGVAELMRQDAVECCDGAMTVSRECWYEPRVFFRRLILRDIVTEHEYAATLTGVPPVAGDPFGEHDTLDCDVQCCAELLDGGF